jgi:hypothetical protein
MRYVWKLACSHENANKYLMHCPQGFEYMPGRVYENNNAIELLVLKGLI